MNLNAINKISKEYRGPFYLFDINSLYDWCDEVTSVFPDGVNLCYAIKANAFLLPYMNAKLNHFEVCSPGEYSICQKYDISSEKIIFSGVVKYKENIEAVLDGGFNGTITLESKKHFELLKEVAIEQNVEHVKVLPRLSSGNKFGMSKEDILDIINECKDSSVYEITGIQFFSGTQKKKMSVIEKELAELDLFMQEIVDSTGLSLNFIEYGPGMLFDYYDLNSDRIEVAKNISELIKPYLSKYKFTLEIGRYFAASCGSYITSVVDIKHTDGKNYCLVDGGIHHVNYYGRMLGMNIPYVVQLKSNNGDFELVSSKDSAESAADVWEVGGALCTVNDVLLRNHPFTDLKEGDLLVFNDTGAYSPTESSVLFLSRTMPKIYASLDGETKLLRDAIDTFNFNS